jgi:hypothetical protein
MLLQGSGRHKRERAFFPLLRLTDPPFAGNLHGCQNASSPPDLRSGATFAPRSTMSTALTEEQARTYMHKLLTAMSQAGGSDLFISADFQPSMKSHGSMQPLSQQRLNGETTRMLAHCLMNETQRAEFEKEMDRSASASTSRPAAHRRHGDPDDPRSRTSEAEAARGAEGRDHQRGLVLVVGATASRPRWRR